MPASPLTGRLLIVVCAVLWSSSGFFAKAPVWDVWPADVRGVALAFWRALFAGLLLLPFMRRPRWNWRLVPMTLAFTAMNAAYLSAMTLTTAANAIWLQNTGPVWVFVLGGLLFGERPNRRDGVPLVFSIAGVGLILWCELASVSLVGLGRLGVLLGLTSGLCYALVVLSIRSLRNENPAWLVAVNHLVAAAILAVPAWQAVGAPSPAQLAVLAAFGLLQMGLPYLLFARGLQTVSSQEAAVLALLEPILLPVWALLAWGERPAWWTLAGGGLILAGLVLRYLRPAGTLPGAPPPDGC